MFKILIVDDEKIVIDAVKFILENNYKDSVEYETARSGREAIEKADLFNPDIILMDIRMPGINGIDAIKEIKMVKPKIHFIIISAYEQFEFAKEAVELKVEDYILKPIIKSNFIEILNKTFNKIDAERESRKRELENIEKQESLVPFLEEGFISTIIIGEKQEKRLGRYREILEIEESNGYVIVFEARGKNDRAYQEEDSEFEMDNDFYTLLCEALKCKCRCFVGPAMLNRVVAFIPTHTTNEQILKREAFEITTYVFKRLDNYIENHTVHIGIGKNKRMEDISESFEEALFAVKYNKNNGITHIDDINVNENNLSEYPMDYENKLIDKIPEGDLEGVHKSFNKIFEWIFSNCKNSYEIGRAKIMELFVLIYRTALINGYKDDRNIHFLLEIGSIEDYLKLEKWCVDKLDEMIEKISLTNQKKNSRIIIKAKEYIYENYIKDITLEDVARETSVTPHYLSRLFKEETGENFIDYLTTFRIKKAKKLMDTTNLNIKEVCYRIGYTDPNYFSRLFKKVEKVTPTDYLRNINKF